MAARFLRFCQTPPWHLHFRESRSQIPKTVTNTNMQQQRSGWFCLYYRRFRKPHQTLNNRCNKCISCERCRRRLVSTRLLLLVPYLFPPPSSPSSPRSMQSASIRDRHCSGRPSSIGYCGESSKISTWRCPSMQFASRSPCGTGRCVLQRCDGIWCGLIERSLPKTNQPTQDQEQEQEQEQ